MISVNSVFVLGAGASFPFGFPTGAKLREMLCNDLQIGTTTFSLIKDAGIDTQRIQALRHAFESSGLSSIDAFIAFRPEFQVVGELAIAATLAPMESLTALTRVNGVSGNSDWYQLLWNQLVAEVGSVEDLRRNKVRFITFNYDRSLEQYLLNAIRHTFDLQVDEAFEVLNYLPIRHVYGSLGDFRPGFGYHYGGHDGDSLLVMLQGANRSIKTVPALRGPRDEMSAQWLAEAQRVFVLGFGFDATNCARIGLHDACIRAPQQVTPINVFASAYQLTSAEKNWCEGNSCTPGRGGLIWTNGDCLNLLRDRRNELK